MNVYVFGRHDGELPRHLVDDGVPGNRVRAMAQLQDGDHDIFYAIEAESDEDLDRHLSAVEASGTTVVATLRPDPDELALFPVPRPPLPAWIPPFEWLCFIIIAIDDVIALIDALRERLGEEAVAVAPTGDGRYVVEIGADDREQLESAIDAAASGADAARHFAPRSGFHRAE